MFSYTSFTYFKDNTIFYAVSAFLEGDLINRCFVCLLWISVNLPIAGTQGTFMASHEVMIHFDKH